MELSCSSDTVISITGSVAGVSENCAVPKECCPLEPLCWFYLDEYHAWMNYTRTMCSNKKVCTATMEQFQCNDTYTEYQVIFYTCTAATTGKILNLCLRLYIGLDNTNCIYILYVTSFRLCEKGLHLNYGQCFNLITLTHLLFALSLLEFL